MIISEGAIDVSSENIKLHQVENIQIARHDFLIQKFKSKFDVVVSNPPYIGIDEFDNLQAEVRDYDPESALTDSKDGLTFHHRFADHFENQLNPGGNLLLEFGGNPQKEAVEAHFQSVGLKTAFFKDLQNGWRVVEVRK